MLFSYDARSLPTTPHPGLAIADSSPDFRGSKARESWLKDEKLKLQKSNRQALLFGLSLNHRKKSYETSSKRPRSFQFIKIMCVIVTFGCDDLARFEPGTDL